MITSLFGVIIDIADGIFIAAWAGLLFGLVLITFLHRNRRKGP